MGPDFMSLKSNAKLIKSLKIKIAGLINEEKNS